MNTTTLNRRSVEPNGVVMSDPAWKRAQTDAPRLIDAISTDFDVTDTYVRVVAAAPGDVWEALSRRSHAEPAARTASALGFSDSLSLPPTLLACRPHCEAVLALAWRVDSRASAVARDMIGSLAEPGHVKVIWSVDVRPIEAGSLLSLTVGFAATDEVTRARLLAAWQLIGPASASVAQRTLATLKADAEENER